MARRAIDQPPVGLADGRIGLLYSSAMSLHAMGMLHDWSDKLTLFADGNDLPEIERQKLERRGIAIIDDKVASLEHQEGRLASVRLESGERIALDALFAHPRQRPAADLHQTLGLDMEEGPQGDLVKVDDRSETSLSGVYAAGDLAHPMQSAILALSRGGLTGVNCHQSLAFADAD